MARPWKHPKTGIYWFRKRVPDELQALLGKSEEKQSLRTRDPSEAKIKQLEVLAAVEARWTNLKAGPRTLTERECHDFARGAHDRWLARYRDNPSEQPWPVTLADKLFAPEPSIWSERPPTDLTVLDTESPKIQELEAWCLREADADLAGRGLKIDETSRLKLAKAIAAAMQRASITLGELAKGLIVPSFPTAMVNGPPLPTAPVVKEPVPFKDLLDGWAAEKRPARRTIYSWTAVIEKLKKAIGHDDAARVTADDLLRWKAAMVAAGRKPKTIRDANLAPVRAILQWAVDNRKLPSNPAERITMGIKSKAGGARRGYTDDEAKLVLKAAMAESDLVRRWVTYLCAYSGARVAEICQLRVEDVVEVGGIWSFKIDPRAGSLKTVGSERFVPLHPALIEAGFLAFVRKIKKGPLFASLPADRFGSRGGNGTKVLGRWVRSLGLDDPRLAPNHSWRHRLKTLARRHGLAPDIVDAIVGHQGRTVADSYGEVEAQAAYREICKIPALNLD